MSRYFNATHGDVVLGNIRNSARQRNDCFAQYYLVIMLVHAFCVCSIVLLEKLSERVGS